MFPFLHRTKLYTVHRKTDHHEPFGDIRLVPEGFSFMACFLTVLWALAHRLWFAAFLVIALNLVLIAIASLFHVDDLGATIVQLALQIWFGFAAHDFLRARYKKEGYVLAAISSGENELRAQQHYFQKMVAQPV